MVTKYSPTPCIRRALLSTISGTGLVAGLSYYYQLNVGNKLLAAVLRE